MIEASREGSTFFEPVKRETGESPVRTRHCKQGAAKRLENERVTEVSGRLHFCCEDL